MTAGWFLTYHEVPEVVQGWLARLGVLFSIDDFGRYLIMPALVLTLVRTASWVRYASSDSPSDPTVYGVFTVPPPGFDHATNLYAVGRRGITGRSAGESGVQMIVGELKSGPC